MAELGNILFDRCEGGYEIERHVGFEDEFHRLFDAVDPNRDQIWHDYGPSFENSTFQIWPYSWCDCDCGYDAVERAWSKVNHHLEYCYQSRSDRAIAEWKAMHDWDAISEASRCDIQREEKTEFGTWHITEHSPKAAAALGQWGTLYDLKNKFERDIHQQLCNELDISWDDGRGSAVHCTCDFNKRWTIFRESHNHDPRCQIARKSFLFKPSGFWIDWYKYPLRDAHSSSEISLIEFGKVVDQCIASLVSDKGGPVLTLETVQGKQ
jgi:hypothetical protein